MRTPKLLNKALCRHVWAVSWPVQRTCGVGQLQSHVSARRCSAGDVVARPMRIETDAGSYRGRALLLGRARARGRGAGRAEQRRDIAAGVAAYRERALDRRSRHAWPASSWCRAAAPSYTVSYRARARVAPELRVLARPDASGTISRTSSAIFRVEPFGQGASLVTVAAAVDFGSGVDESAVQRRGRADGAQHAPGRSASSSSRARSPCWSPGNFTVSSTPRTGKARELGSRCGPQHARSRQRRRSQYLSRSSARARAARAICARARHRRLRARRGRVRAALEPARGERSRRGFDLHLRDCRRGRAGCDLAVSRARAEDDLSDSGAADSASGIPGRKVSRVRC